VTGQDWIEAFARKLGTPAPTAEEFEQLLALAGVAAHSSERLAAPVACWVAARARITPDDALAAAKEVAPE
jgi:hypothetical protein